MFLFCTVSAIRAWVIQSGHIAVGMAHMWLVASTADSVGSDPLPKVTAHEVAELSDSGAHGSTGGEAQVWT